MTLNLSNSNDLVVNSLSLIDEKKCKGALPEQVRRD